MEWGDRVVVITGATGGLGKEVVKTFLGAGAHVVFTYRNEAKLEALLSDLQSFKTQLDYFKTNLTEEPSVQELARKTVEKHKKIDGLVNLVGGFAGGETISETTQENWDFLMNLNLKSVFLSSKAVVSYMINQKYGKIVNVSSKAAVQRKAKAGPYSVSKAGVITFTRTLADEVKGDNINVNAILPSIIATEANIKRMPAKDHSRWVTPREIAEVVLFLTSEGAGGINGVAIPVFGKLL